MKPYDIYQLENDFNYNCDFGTRTTHINRLRFMETREEQDEYMQDENITSK